MEGIDDIRARAAVETVEDLDGFVFGQEAEDDRGFGGRELGDELSGRIGTEIADGGTEGREITIVGQRPDSGGVEDRGHDVLQAESGRRVRGGQASAEEREGAQSTVGIH